MRKERERGEEKGEGRAERGKKSKERGKIREKGDHREKRRWSSVARG